LNTPFKFAPNDERQNLEHDLYILPISALKLKLYVFKEILV